MPPFCELHQQYYVKLGGPNAKWGCVSCANGLPPAPETEAAPTKCHDCGKPSGVLGRNRGEPWRCMSCCAKAPLATPSEREVPAETHYPLCTRRECPHSELIHWHVPGSDEAPITATSVPAPVDTESPPDELRVRVSVDLLMRANAELRATRQELAEARSRAETAEQRESERAAELGRYMLALNTSDERLREARATLASLREQVEHLPQYTLRPATADSQAFLMQARGGEWLRRSAVLALFDHSPQRLPPPSPDTAPQEKNG